MYNYDDIIARLRAGEDSEVIAKEMVDTLNRANKDFVDEMNAASNQKAKKADMIRDMMDILEDYITEFHPTNPLVQMFAETADKDVNELVEQIDEAIEQMAVMHGIMEKVKADLGPLFDQLGAPSQIKVTPTGKGDAISPKPDAISAFLKANGLV